MIIVQLDSEQLTTLIQSSVRKVLSETNFQKNESVQESEQLFTIQQAAEFLNLTVPTLYSKSSKCELPVMKRGNRLYFSKQELTKYLQAGRKQTFADVKAEADVYLSNNKLGLKHGK
jgi:excisionase family DNA binding protein